MQRKVIVIGGGIIGLAVARELAFRGDHVSVCEKEDRWAAHQSGHNSGVAHAGLYYAPGSQKARMAVAGCRSIVDYARAHGVRSEVCGKLVVATGDAELPRLRALAERAEANGVPATLIGPAQAREYEPAVSCVQALRVETTALVDFPGICEALAAELTDKGADLRLNTTVRGIRSLPGGAVEVHMSTGGGSSTGGHLSTYGERADVVVNCAGLHADRVARMAGLRPPARIVPFRGEYYALRPSAEHLVRGLIYPVPDPPLPFLGVHLTRMLDGSVHAGPNAVIALRREGYRWRDVSARDVAQIAGNRGVWRLAGRYRRTAVDEVLRSLSRRRFARSLQRLVPALTEADIVRHGSGVRAQALRPDGSLVDDFLIQRTAHGVHVLNAPSPAATCALEIGRHVADEVSRVASG